MAEITLGTYIFERLKQIDVKTIFGVPGDFNLALLDHIYEVEGMRWAGNANELNAAYAADGYSRVKSMAALITTFGVGELSAVNGIAGSFAEHVGLLHIVGVPAISSQEKKLLLHHTLGNGDFGVFKRVFKNVSKSANFISDINEAQDMIDGAIREAFIYQRPIYLGLPTNLVEMKVDRTRLNTPIDLKPVPNPVEAEEEALQSILELISKASKPIILVDACASRHFCQKEVDQLIDITNFPVFVTPMGKGGVNEQKPQFGGAYVGSLSNPNITEFVEKADLVISVGALLSDFNTGSFSYSHSKNIVEFHSDYTQIRSAVFRGVQMKALLQKLLPLVGKASKHITAQVPPKIAPPIEKGASEDLTQDWLWSNISKFLRADDVVITETGTSAFGIVQSRFPTHVSGISQVLWGSIGFSVGATLGAVCATEELDPNRRVILFVGDGSLQLTVQEISTMARWNLKPYLFILNNDGYTIERLIHGEKASYNDIQPWDHLKLLDTFKAKNSESTRVSTVGELTKLFKDQGFNKPDKIRVIEIMLETMDAPISLVKQAEITAKTNAA
ncbi:Pyruvate decarboxylase 1 [Komagataella kurtzmanii]|nr:Pyruvate decarboxylase 1 [Komagataella kurtzmanii]